MKKILTDLNIDGKVTANGDSEFTLTNSEDQSVTIQELYDRDKDPSSSTVTFTDDSTTFNPSTDNIQSGGLLSTLFQKIKKWFSNLGDLAFINKDGDTSNKYLKGDGTWGNPSSSSVYLGSAAGDSLLAYIKTCISNGYKVGFFDANGSVQSGCPDTTNVFIIQYQCDTSVGNAIQLMAWQYGSSANQWIGYAWHNTTSEPTWTQNIDTRHIDGVANYLPKFTGNHTIEDASHIYVDDHSAGAISGTYKNGLFITGQTYGNNADLLQSGTAGVLTYGDGGPQVEFGYSSDGQKGTLLFTDHDTAASGASFHFLSNQTDWNVISKRFHARTGISIGTDLPPTPSTTSVQLYVNGTAAMNSIGSLNGMFFPYVGGGRYRTNTVTVTGALCITLPTGYTSHMMSFWVDVYEYYEDNSTGRNLYSYFLGGYNYKEDSKWHNYAAKCYGYGDKATRVVRFCKNSSNKPCITIGETNTTWNYPQVTIRDVTIGYGNSTNDYNTGWSISFVTTLPTVQWSIDLSSQYSVHKSMASDYITVHEHSTNNIWYPVVWDNTYSQLFHTTNKFQFNPSNGQLKVTGGVNVLQGNYTLNGGKQNPNYFGTNRVGCLMMNTDVAGNTQYKDWLIMDCYSGNDVGGAVAIGVNRQSLGLYIMRSEAARTSWTESAEILGTHKIWTGTLAQYNAISSKNASTIYLISD